MKGITFLALLLVAAGCDLPENDEVGKLKTKVLVLERENQELRKVAPTEQPKLAKDLDQAREDVRRLTAELAAARGAIVPDVQPLAAALLDLRVRLAALEANASRKGHTHTYRPGDGFSTATGAADR